MDQIDATLLVNIVTPQQKFQSSQDLQSFHQCTCIRSPLKIEACNYIYILYIYIYLFIYYIYIYTISFKKTKQLPLGENGRIRRLVYHKLPISSLCLPYFETHPHAVPVTSWLALRHTITSNTKDNSDSNLSISVLSRNWIYREHLQASPCFRSKNCGGNHKCSLNSIHNIREF